MSAHIDAAIRHHGPIKALRERFARLADIPLVRRFIALHDRLCGEHVLPPVDLQAIRSHDAMAFVLTLRGYDVEHLIGNAGRERFGCPKLHPCALAKIHALIVSQSNANGRYAEVARKNSARGGAP